MKPVFPLPRLAGLLFSLAVCATAPAALAQTTKVFVASYGNNANDGSRGSPKRTFQAAHNAVTAGGQIVVLDLASYNDLTITKSVAVTVPPGVNGIITVAGASNAITINAGAGDIVSLRGLIIEGDGNTQANGIGILATQVGTLRVEDCTIRSFATGVFFNPVSNSSLVMQGGSVRDVFSGIAIESGANSVSVDAVITGCTVDKTIQTALASYASRTGTSVRLTATRCTLTHNGAAFDAIGSGAVTYADACLVSGNTTGVSSFDQGQTITRSNNTFYNNSDNGTFSSTLAPK